MKKLKVQLTKCSTTKPIKCRGIAEKMAQMILEKSY